MFANRCEAAMPASRASVPFADVAAMGISPARIWVTDVSGRGARYTKAAEQDRVSLVGW